LTLIKQRLARPQDILFVYGGVVFLVFSWAFRGFFDQLTSLRLYHSVGEIMAVFSYLMAFALLESLVFTGGLILLGFILPQKWLKEGFAYKGFLATLVAAIAMIFLHYYLFSLHYATPPMQVIYEGFGIGVAVLIFLIWISQNFPKVQNFLLALVERLQVFSYLYIPLGLIGLVVVILRNI
jgi:hypothetical protein